LGAPTRSIALGVGLGPYLGVAIGVGAAWVNPAASAIAGGGDASNSVSYASLRAGKGLLGLNQLHRLGVANLSVVVDALSGHLWGVGDERWLGY
jgi:hypothetical protein